MAVKHLSGTHLARLCLLLVLLIPSIGTALAEETPVLVSSRSAPAFQLTRKEVRLLFMGLPVTKDSRSLQALLNISDPLAYQVFLQKVIYMSAQNYEKRLLSKVFRLGGRRPPKFRDQKQLLRALTTRPDTVSFMWESRARQHPQLRIVTPLWSGSIE